MAVRNHWRASSGGHSSFHTKITQPVHTSPKAMTNSASAPSGFTDEERALRAAHCCVGAGSATFWRSGCTLTCDLMKPFGPEVYIAPLHLPILVAVTKATCSTVNSASKSLPVPYDPTHLTLSNAACRPQTIAGALRRGIPAAIPRRALGKNG